jgi:sugar lactone lactonase YvrE
MRMLLPVLVIAAACAPDGNANEEVVPAPSSQSTVLDSTQLTATTVGLDRPEAVRWDPEQRVWFVANFGPGRSDERDGDGYISRLDPDVGIDSLRFMRGTEAAALHMPRGMFIVGDTLWVADVDGIHGFDRTTGRHLAFVDFRAHEPGFLNDLAAGPDGVLYVTDTGRSRVYRVAGASATPEIAAEDLPIAPNGITWDAARGAFLLAPWGDGNVIHALTPNGVVEPVVTVDAGRFDGIELVRGGLLLATQTDSSLWLVENGQPRRVVRTRGAPADIAYDPVAGVVAVPYIALDRVDFWTLRR